MALQGRVASQARAELAAAAVGGRPEAALEARTAAEAREAAGATVAVWGAAARLAVEGGEAVALAAG